MKPQESEFDALLTDHVQRTTPRPPHPRYQLDAVKARIALDRQSALKSIASEKTSVGSIGNWLQRLFAVPSPRFALALGVIAVQFAAIGGLALHALRHETSMSEVRSTRGMAAPADTQFIRVSIKAQVTEAQMRKLLNSVQVDIVAGPSQIGEYYLLTSSERIANCLAQLKSSGLVEAADIVKSLP